MIPTEKTYKLVDFLGRAAARKDAAVLGALRRGWAQPLAIYPIVAPFLPLPPSKRAEDVALLVACLFGGYPALGTTPLAVALRASAARRGSASAERLVTSLLTATFGDLAGLLPRAVALAKAEGMALDWHRLMGDLRRWDREGKPAQRAWARAYWGAGPDTGPGPASEGAAGATDHETSKETR